MYVSVIMSEPAEENKPENRGAVRGGARRDRRDSP